MVLDAVERLGIEPSFCAGHSLGEYTALTATGALGFDDGVRLVVARADAMHEAGLAQPGTMAAVLGLDDDQVDVACRRADEDVWVANYNAPGPGRHRRLARRRRRGDRPRQGARRQEGHAAAGVGRVPHAVHDGRPQPPAGGDRRGRPTRHRGARRLQRRRPPPPRGQGVGQPAVGPAVVARALEAVPAGARGPRRHRLRRARPGRRAHRHGQAHARRRPHDLRRHARGARQAASSGSAPASPTGAGPRRGRAPLRQRAPRRQPGGRRSSRPPPGIADGSTHRRRHRARPRRRTRGRARRSPARCRATSPSRPNGSPPANRSPGSARAEGGPPCPPSTQVPAVP